MKYEIILSKNIKENVSEFGILSTLSQPYLCLKNFTASIYKLSIHSVHPVGVARIKSSPQKVPRLLFWRLLRPDQTLPIFSAPASRRALDEAAAAVDRAAVLSLRATTFPTPVDG